MTGRTILVMLVLYAVLIAFLTAASVYESHLCGGPELCLRWSPR